MAQVTLTFDNGPEPEVTPHVLDVLAGHAIQASFFVIGGKLANPEGRKAAERAKAEGHWIGNHSYTHSVSLGEAPQAAFDDEVTKTQQEIGDLAHPDRLFRPYCNSGVLDKRVLKRGDVDRLVVEKYTCVLFNALTRDWEDGEGWVDAGLREINSRPWTTLVMHDIPRTGAMRQLDRFVNLVKDEGHEFVQNFSPDCVPVLRGDILLPMDGYVSG
jgi:peptidoglycan/xylan/chitin deacetylase (PgdA/CDA1 family)